MQLAIDRDKCIASGACVLAAPDVFDQDEDGVVVLLTSSPPPELEEAAREGIRACPAGVIWESDDRHTDLG